MQNHRKPPLPPPLSVSQPTPTSHSHSNSDDSPHSIDNSDDSPHTINSDESPHTIENSDESTHLTDNHSPNNGDNNNNNNRAIVAFEKYYSPLTSPLPLTPPKDATTPDNFSSITPHYVHHNFNRSQNFPPPPPRQPSAVVYGGERKETRFSGGNGLSDGGGESVVVKVNLGVRVLEILFCLISFSVMAADKTQGWSGDSFDRHKEYRFCLSVSVLGFLYAAFQAYDASMHFATGKHVIRHHLRYHFVFIMDQILAYLLISASSSAASRIDDWQSNWGKDEFTNKASASVSMAFLAFLGFAITSLISGYNLCNRDSS